MASTLPFEIISNIADLLPKEDLIHCIRVCRAWVTPVQEVLWHTIKINSPTKLNAICYILASKNNTSGINHYTRKLLLVDGLETSDTQLHLIQCHFQNLQHLFIERKCLSDHEFGKMADWNMWKLLEELDIDLDGLDSVNAKDEFLKILSCLPSLVSLNLTQFWQKRNLAFELGDFEEIHTHLPRLKNMSLSIDIHVLSDEDWPCILAAEPALDLTHFKLKFGCMSYRWLFYFARKYPNICNLESEFFEHYARSKEGEDEAIMMFSNAPSLFSHLNTVDLNTAGYFERIHTLFWKISQAIDMPIKNLSHALVISPKKAYLVEESVNKYTHSFSSTLETLSMRSTVPSSHLRPITPEFEYCPRLVELNLDKCFSSIDLDFILSRCKALKMLKMKTNLVTITVDAHYTPERHSLQEIHISGASIGSHVLSYLSFRCRQLNSMYLDNVKILGNLCPESKNIRIKMPYTSLKVLYCDYLSFHPAEDPRINDNMISILLINQTGNSQFPDEDFIIEDIVAHNPPYSAKLGWYLISRHPVPTDSKRFEMRRLQKEETERATECFIKSQKRLDLSSNTDIQHPGIKHRFEYEFDKRLTNGYATIIFKDIADIYVKPNVAKVTWAKIK
ncbi:hypothetical protein J3Q64DRAFT_1703011 [Phycomyces blakesleeanus]|uniref:F-box domain-containing protein n=2 Tax=Phycomyces blakesleeanus TaxID=4837 RepID=A0A162PMT6_PHYB8|nr:hypothetical protein PHYBLDRAFT_70655 [Phycomyces blakesleeanus NRRL 1555(-)]OAD70426.1 hypothetical protein PHYBLDRAFT_70655 [Phycomyces blakesleeanus NRRL 1555(-)]|eukprot:XP_018288466.1 hypothetical protein PHYBLDRAFT_70655 [Phycomyces blakesleeanus NRRL 1555(-)]